MVGTMRAWPLALALLVLLLLPAAGEGAIVNASIVNATSNLTVPVYYYTSGKAYTDQVGGNPDFKLEICTDGSPDLTGNYTNWAYKAGNSSDFKLIGEYGGTGPTNTTLTSSAGNCYYTNDSWNFYDSAAVYPGIIYAVVSADSSIDASDTWIEIRRQGNNNWLRGSYTLNDFAATLDEATGRISAKVTSITGATSAGSQAIYPGGTSVNKKAIVLGVCTNTTGLDGWSCSDSNLTSPGVLNSLDTGVSPSESAAYTRYLLVNGINNSFCIGPDLAVTNVSLNVSSVYQSELVLINATVQNSGNVNVSSDFNISFWDNSNFLANVTLNGLNRTQTRYPLYSFDTTGLLSGGHTITAKVEDNNLGDCSDANDNSTATLNIKKTYNMTVLINGTETSTFPRPGRPYNVSVIVDDSDGDAGANITVKITEKNGMNLFAPVQGFDAEGERRGVVSLATAEVMTNSSGITNFAVIPTGNKLYLSSYSYQNATDHIGNYSLFIELFNGSEELQLYNATSDKLIGEYNLTLANQTVLDPSLSEENSIYVFNHNKWVKTVIEFIVQVFGNIQKWTAP